MQIKLKNTRSGRVQDFNSVHDGEVRMYHCGPTVYDRAHIGNLRAYVFADLLRRMFEYNGFTVKQVINITDIGHLSDDADAGDDKMVRALQLHNLPQTHENLRMLAEKYAELFRRDISALNVLPAHQMPFASDHIAEDITLIEKLQEKGLVYKTSDGLYFDTAQDPNYGALAKSTENSQENSQSRIAENQEKKNQQDFALWKFNETHGYESPLGRGFPGWHIECSAMGMKYLGESFDIHTGGVDHIAVHHNNEIAQSENATGKTFANYWMHSEFLSLGQDKIAKSAGNIITLDDLAEQGIEPLAYRYFLLQAHYSSPISFSLQALQAAQNALDKLRRIKLDLEKDFDPNVSVDSRYQETFHQAINNDLAIPSALSVLHDMLHDASILDSIKYATLLDFDRVLGMNLSEWQDNDVEITTEMQELMTQRNHARAKKDWEEADRLRDELRALGLDIVD